MDDYSFITEIDGEVYLEPENYEERFVSLEMVFELYTDPEMEADDVARMVGIDESDIVNAVFYWSEEPGVYEQLAEEANLGPGSEIYTGSDPVDSGQELPETGKLPAPKDSVEASRNLGRKYVSSPVNPLQAAGNAFLHLKERDGTPISEQNIEDIPVKSYLGEDMIEAHLSWRMNDSRLEVYTGWDGDIGPDTGFVSYSVDGEMGEILEVKLDEIEDMVEEMYRNAVFGSL